jgi:hypothetical protein
VATALDLTLEQPKKLASSLFDVTKIEAECRRPYEYNTEYYDIDSVNQILVCSSSSNCSNPCLRHPFTSTHSSCRRGSAKRNTQFKATNLLLRFVRLNCRTRSPKSNYLCVVLTEPLNTGGAHSTGGSRLERLQ